MYESNYLVSFATRPFPVDKRYRRSQRITIYSKRKTMPSTYNIRDYNTLNKGTHDLNVKNKLIKGNNSNPVK
jgi:hypothetical protein